MANECYPYKSPAPEGQFPIIVMSAIPSHNNASISDYEIMKECGINVAFLTGDDLQIANGFDVLNQSGIDINIIVSNSHQLCNSIDSITQHFINLYKNQPHLRGWCYYDEPNYYKIVGEYESVKNKDSENLSSVQKRIYQTDPNDNHLIFANLVAATKGYVKDDAMGFPAFLDVIQDKLQVPVWCFDYYPIWYFESSGNQESEIYEYTNSSNNKDIYLLLKRSFKRINRIEGFYQYLEYFRNQSIKTDRPIWSVVPTQQLLGMAADGKIIKGMPVLTLAELRYQAFTALAYGAQGIVYWRYAQADTSWPMADMRINVFEKLTFSYVDEYMLTTPINWNDKKTPIWPVLQRLNSEIQRCSVIFLESEVKGIVHTHLAKIPNYFFFGSNNTADRENLAGSGVTIIKGSFACLNSIETNGAGVMISWITKDSMNFLVIVSHDPFNSQDVKMNIMPGVVCTLLVDPDDLSDPAGSDDNLNINGGTEIKSTILTKTLPPGGYMIIHFH